jgi:signal transduction histidine kinase
MTRGAAPDVAALLRIATLVACRAPEEEVFAAACDEVGRLSGAEATAVLHYLGAERAVVVGVWRKGGIRGMPVNAEVDFDARTSALGQVWATRAAARADSYEQARGELAVVMQAIGLRSSIAAPVIVGEEVWGALVGSTTREEPFPEGSEEVIARLGPMVGQAVANADARRGDAASRLRLVEDADATRRRLERALHEGHQQQLLSLALELRLARSRADEGSEVAAALDRALGAVMEANASLRAYAREVYPAVLAERGLGAAFQGLAARARVPVYVEELPRRRFPAVVETTVYFVAGEAFAGAEGDVAVSFADHQDRLVMEISGAASPGPGLLSLVDRAAALGGRLELGGTVIRLELPLER